uniref:Zinc finger protein 292b n=1 Tax=Mastacembelus armatus TaxID=205130 RepID=A0A7N8Y5G2_9TELE
VISQVHLTLLMYASCWKIEEEPLPLVEVYIVALLSYAQASPYLSLQCENVPLVVERLSLVLYLNSIVTLLFLFLLQFAHSKLQENGLPQLSLLFALGLNDGVWTNKVLQGILSSKNPRTEQVQEFLMQEGPVLLGMRVTQLMKDKQLGRAAVLAKTCSDCPAFQGKGLFKQMYLVCLCATSKQDQLMDELSKEDCRDALEMICNLESEGDETAAFSLCSAFLMRQLLQGDMYCAWELTLFWSKLLKRLEPSEQAFLDRCRQMSSLSKTVYHVLFLIKVIQSEIDNVGLPVCIEMCIRALQMDLCDRNSKVTVCKTISCLLPTDLEVKQACQLTEFLLEPTVDSYYAVEMLYNEPDQKLEEENMPIPNSLRCELLLVFKTQWPFDPEFWDWKTLKRHCLSLMGKEASIVSSIDLLNDSESPEEGDDFSSQEGLKNFPDHLVSGTYELKDITDKRQKNREMKKLREKGFISARFRNWQAYMQYCVLCDKEFLGHRIVRHAQTHLSGGVYSCPICTQTFSSKDTLIPHVTSHVKLSCKERLTAMKTNRKLADPKTAAPVIAALKAKTGNQLYENGDSLGQNGGLVNNVQAAVARCNREKSEGNVCPVGKCCRSFKFFKNLIAHVKAHGDNEEAKTFLEMQSKKVVCQYCRRHFVNVTHLNDHLQVHCGVKPYICIQLNCKASFLSNTELLIHRKTHSVFKARCMFPNCGRIFNEAFKLYDHEAQHYKTFTCKVVDCGKVFHSQQQLDLHQEEHATKEERPSSEQMSQNRQPGTSPVEEMLSNHTPLKRENWSTEPDHRLSLSPESLLESSEVPVDTLGHTITSSVFVKPFACEKDNCTFSSMSSEALWKHLSKTHNYTLEMVNVVKKRYGQYAPFKCQKCSKTFTRNSNLRTHYQSAHKLSAEEIADLDLKRRLAKNAASAAIQNQPVNTNQSVAAHTTMATAPIMENIPHLYSLQDAVKHDYKSQAFVPFTNMHNTMTQPQCHTSTSAFQSVRAGTAAEQWSHGHQRNLPKVLTQHTSVQQAGAHVGQVSAPLTKALSVTSEANGPLSVNRQSAVKPSIDITKKMKEKKPTSSDAMSPYRPYRCVHQGCVAAFTIQHNLILHYRAVHQSALSALEVNKEQDQGEGLDEILEHEEDEELDAQIPQSFEFRCQVKDCSRVFQHVPNLLQHYLQLHEFSLDRVGSLLSGVKLGKFACGHQGCTAFFTTLWKYVGHVKEQHKDVKLAKPEHLNGSFKCEIEGCDRSYATKSNLLRHVMKKHQDHQAKFKNQQITEDGVKQNSKSLLYHVTKTSNGKENIESNKKILQRGSDTKKVSKSKNNHWTKYGKPSLKSKVEASAMCTKKFPLQYPCMIKGCESVMKSERSMLKHYKGHGLSEKYLEGQRSHFIFCKKLPRQKCYSIRSDDSKSDNNSDLSDNELTTNTIVEEGEYGYSKPVLRKRTTGGIPAALFDSKLSNDESYDGSVVLKRKRGRPRKLIDKIVKRKKIPRMTKMDVVYSRDDESDSSCPAVPQEEITEQSTSLASFKPMGFEMSFLEFLEQSNKCEHAFTKKLDVPETSSLGTKDTCVRFSNRQNMKSLGKVKIIIDGAFSGVSERMLKQLQDMQPTVILENND